MVIQRTVPFADGMALGLGIDDLTGNVGSLRAVDFASVASADGDQGMEARYDTSLVHSSEQMYDSLGVSVAAEGRYGLFSAQGKFRFAEETRFNSSSTFLVARADIQNAFERIVDPVPVQDAQQLVRDGKPPEQFRARYGDLFIRGVKSGGEYIAVLSITSRTEENQRELGLALKASFDGLVASGSVAVDIQTKVSKLRQESEVRVSTYQRGGSGEQISYTGTVEAVMDRLKTFAAAVKQSPKAYSVQAVSYDTLVFPDSPNPFDIRRQQEVLEDCMRKRLQLLTIRNDIEMVLLHPEYFRSPPDRTTLSGWSVSITDTLNRLEAHVSAVIDSISETAQFPLTLPDGLALPDRLQHTGEQVEIYTHSDFGKGPDDGVTPRSQKLGLGWYDNQAGQLHIGNDQISSIRVPEGLAVRGYEHAWFQGATIDFTADVPALAEDWNNRISALVVYQAADGPPRVEHVVALDFPWSRPLVLKPGRYPDLAATALGAGSISTLLIPRGLAVRMWEAPEFQGATAEFTTDILELPPDWNNRAASLEVRDVG